MLAKAASHIAALEAKLAETEALVVRLEKNRAVDLHIAKELERERCAKIAELRRNTFGGEPTTNNERCIVEHIAAAIRGGDEA